MITPERQSAPSALCLMRSLTARDMCWPARGVKFFQHTNTTPKSTTTTTITKTTPHQALEVIEPRPHVFAFGRKFAPPAHSRSQLPKRPDASAGRWVGAGVRALSVDSIPACKWALWLRSSPLAVRRVRSAGAATASLAKAFLVSCTP